MDPTALVAGHSAIGHTDGTVTGGGGWAEVRGGEVVRGSVVATDGPPEDVDLRQLTLEAVLAGEGIDISASGSMWLCLRDEATVVRQCLSSHMHASLPTQTVVVLGFAER